jgi:hypothetical protein
MSEGEYPVRLKRRKKLLTICICIIVGLPLLWRGWREIVPSGASPVPYILGGIHKTVLHSPRGDHTLQIVYNDAGAAHSGNHWTWIIRSHWLLGRKVVAEGYSGTWIIRDPYTVQWQGEDRFAVSFCEGRYEEKTQVTAVALD